MSQTAWRITISLLLVVLIAPATFGEARELAEQRWSEQKFGLSLRPPVDSRMIQQNHDDYLVRFIDAERKFQLTATMKQSREQLGLMDVAEAVYLNTASQFAAPGNARVEVEDSDVFQSRKVGDKQAAVAYLYPLPPSGERAVIAQAVVLVDPYTFAVIEVRGAEADEDVIKPTFQAVLETVRFTDQREVAAERKAAVEATVKWRDGLGPADYKQLLGRKDYYRILEDDEDVGWMIVETGESDFTGSKGVRVRVKTHLELSGREVDSLADYFRPYRGFEGEAWSIRTTVRGGNSAGGQNNTRSTAETGATTRDSVQVTIDGTSGSKTRNLRFMRPRSPEWARIQRQLDALRRSEQTKPVRREIEQLAGRAMELRSDVWAYLPQADTWLVGHLLPRDVAGTYGFYAYDRQSESISYLTMRLTPTLRGYTITIRPTPNDEPRKSVYDGQGNLIRKELGEGRVLQRSDRQSLQTLWKLR